MSTLYTANTSQIANNAQTLQSKEIFFLQRIGDKIEMQIKGLNKDLLQRSQQISKIQTCQSILKN